MKLSEAIRLGSMLKPQVRDEMFAENGTCALGAAYEAIGLSGNNFHYQVSVPGWMQALIELPAPVCPQCLHEREGRILGDVVIHLNDDHYWTREQIADWVETVEAAQEQTQEQPVSVEA